jgi:putative glycosyl hydrolase
VQGYDVLVSFEHGDGEDCRVRACHLPEPGELRDAFLAFRARWPAVTTFSAWNEGNHPGQPTAARPASAARLYETLVSACPQCRILAAEVVDIDNMASWLRSFNAALTTPARLWGLHNYGDVTRGRTSFTDAMLSLVDGDVWITETGGLVRQSDAGGVLRWPTDEERARASLARAFALADAHPDRIPRLYVYQWQAGAWESWDSGLLRPDGTLRPSFTEFMAHVPAPAGPQPPHTSPGEPSKYTWPRLHVLRRPALGRDGRVRTRVRCEEARCRIRLGVMTLKRRGLGATTQVVAAGRTVTLAVRLPASRRRLIRRGVTSAVTAGLGITGQRPRSYRVRCRL